MSVFQTTPYHSITHNCLKASKTRVVANLIKMNENKESVKVLLFELTFYGGIARMKVTDPASIKPR